MSLINYGLGHIKNWQGNPSHPIDNYVWFKTSVEEREKLGKMYDELTNGDPAIAKKLDKLIDELRSIAVIESEFHSGDDQ